MAWNLLFTSDMGVLSLLTILFMLGMPVYIAFFVRRHIKMDNAGKAATQNRVDGAKSAT